jgi:ABC-type multidrug transport system fused ATPase/permease subunit
MKDLHVLIRCVFPFWKRYWKQEGLIGLVLALLLTSQLAIPVQFRNTIDSVFIYGSMNVFVESLFYLSLLLVVSSGLTWVFQIVAAWVGESIIIDITSKTYRHVLTQRRSFWLKYHPEDVLTRLTQDILAVKSFSVDFLHSVILQGVSMIAFLIVLLYFSVKIGLMIALFIPAIFFLAYWGDRYLNKNATEVRILASRFTGVFRFGIWNPPMNFSWDLFRFHRNVYQNLAVKMKRAQVGLVNRVQIIGQGVTVLNILVATIGVIFLLYYDYQAGLLSTGQVFALFMYAGQATQSTIGLAGVFAASKIDRVSVLRITELLSETSLNPKPANPDTDIIMHPFFRGSLDPGVKIPEMETYIAELTAENGAGKTTLSQVLGGYDDLGNCIVNDRWFLLPSDPPVFPGTLSDNIRIISGTDAGNDVILRILESHNLSILLSAFPEDLSTAVSDGTELISRGQKQITALLGAIVKDPPLLFIDEGFNSIDVKIKKETNVALHIWLANRKVIVVDHYRQRSAAVPDVLVIGSH